MPHAIGSRHRDFRVSIGLRAAGLRPLRSWLMTYGMPSMAAWVNERSLAA